MTPERRRQLLVAGSVVLALAAAFSAGRFTAPERVQVREVERVEWRDRIVEKRVEVAAAARVETRVVYRDRVITKDGTVTEHEVERSGAVTETKTETKVDRAEEHEGKREVVREVRVEVRPDWRAAVLVGASVREPLLPVAGPLVVGVEVDRRIIGGLSAGVWASTVGAAGVSLSLEF